jgi:hypothetical protein
MSIQTDQEDLRKRAADLDKLIKRLALTSEPLESDWRETIKRWQKEGKSQFWSRIAIRTLCASIEARLYSFRKMAEQMAPLEGVQFDSEETAILSEEKVVLTHGVEKKRPKWLPFPDSVKESFRLFAKAVGATIRIDYGTGGFLALCRTFEVRNRLMHPKEPFDIQVAARDINTAEQGIAWFNKTYVDVLDKCQTHIDQKVEAMKTSKCGS